MKSTSPKLKICHCLWTGDIGGIERVTTTLVLAQREKDTVGVLFGKSGGPFYQQLQTAGVPVHILGMKSGFTLSPALMRQATSWFQQFDIIHLQAFNYLLWIAAIRSGKHIVFTFHSLTSLRKKPTWRDHISQRFMNYCLLRYIETVTTVSEFAREHLKKERPALKEIEVIPNCILPAKRTQTLTRAELDIPSDAPILLTYGRLVWHKRVDWIVERLPQLILQFPNLVYVIEGGGPEKTKLQAMVKAKGLEKNVRFPGFSDRIFDLLPLADLCVFPSHAESFGLVTLECLQAGKVPLVLADGGGLAEVMGPLAQGACIAEDADALVQKAASYLKGDWTVKKGDMQKLVKQYQAKNIAGFYRVVYTKSI